MKKLQNLFNFIIKYYKSNVFFYNDLFLKPYISDLN